MRVVFCMKNIFRTSTKRKENFLVGHAPSNAFASSKNNIPGLLPMSLPARWRVGQSPSTAARRGTTNALPNPCRGTTVSRYWTMEMAPTLDSGAPRFRNSPWEEPEACPSISLSSMRPNKGSQHPYTLHTSLGASDVSPARPVRTSLQRLQPQVHDLNSGNLEDFQTLVFTSSTQALASLSKRVVRASALFARAVLTHAIKASLPAALTSAGGTRILPNMFTHTE